MVLDPEFDFQRVIENLTSLRKTGAKLIVGTDAGIGTLIPIPKKFDLSRAQKPE